MRHPRTPRTGCPHDRRAVCDACRRREAAVEEFSRKVATRKAEEKAFMEAQREQNRRELLARENAEKAERDAMLARAAEARRAAGKPPLSADWKPAPILTFGRWFPLPLPEEENARLFHEEVVAESGGAFAALTQVAKDLAAERQEIQKRLQKADTAARAAAAEILQTAGLWIFPNGDMSTVRWVQYESMEPSPDERGQRYASYSYAADGAPIWDNEARGVRAVHPHPAFAEYRRIHGDLEAASALLGEAERDRAAEAVRVQKMVEKGRKR